MWSVRVLKNVREKATFAKFYDSMVFFKGDNTPGVCNDLPPPEIQNSKNDLIKKMKILQSITRLKIFTSH